MSAKRQKKKEEQRAGALEQRLADLYRRQADDACLELVHERGRTLPPERLSPDRYREAVERALRRALAGSDWQGVGKILKRVRRDVAGALPLVELVESSRNLVEGRLGEARAGLATLTAESDGLPPGLATSLMALASGEEALAAEPQVRDLARRMDLLRDQGFRITSQEIHDFDGVLTALEVAILSDGPARQLLEATRERLRLLDSLTTLERDLLRDLGHTDMRILGPFLEEVRQHWLTLTEVLRAEPPWNLVRPLHHAVRLTWRGLLQLVAGREGTPAWVTLYGVWPELLSNDLEGETGAARKALQSGMPWLEWQDLLDRYRFHELAEFLSSKSRTERDPERLADLWDAELWCRERVAWSESQGGPVAMSRLEWMTADLGRRVPPERRPEVARRLREHLLALCELEEFSHRFLETAKTLLVHDEDDPALLAVALASAVCAEEDRDRDLFTERIAARGVASAKDRDQVLGVVSNLGKEVWLDIVEGLPRLRPLLEPEDWDEAVRLSSQGISHDVLEELSCGWDKTDLELLSLELESARRALPDVAALPTLELAVMALAAGELAPGLVRSSLEGSPTLEDALLLYRALAMGDPLEPGMVDAVTEARAAVTARLDSRWPLWRHHLRLLLDEASLEEIRRVKQRLQALLEAESLDAIGRGILRDSLAEVTDHEEKELLHERRLVESPGDAGEPEGEEPEEKEDPELDDETWDDWEEEDWDEEEDDEEDEEPDLSEPTPYDKEHMRIQSLLERLFPPPRFVMKPLGREPEPLQEKDLEPLLRPLRRQVVEEMLRVGLGR